jgi:uncharacterized membrane protein YczE
VKTKINLKNSILYVVGLMFITMGVALSFRHGFGASSADNLSYIVSKVLSITLGTAAFIVNSSIIVMLLIYFRNWKFLFLFVQVFIFSPFIDFWDLWVFANLNPVGWERIIVFAASLLTLPFGCALLIKSTYPAGVYDELMFFTAHITKFKLTVSRMFNELLLVVLSVIISLSTGNGFGSVSLGTFGYVFSIGYLIKFYLTTGEMLFNRRKKNATKSND